DLVMRLTAEAPLVELLALRQRRAMRDVEREGRRVAVLSLDRVEFGAPPLPTTFELEIELTPGGDAAHLDALVRALAPFALKPQALSKFERALALADSTDGWAPAPLEHHEAEAAPPAASRDAETAAKAPRDAETATRGRRKARVTLVAPGD